MTASALRMLIRNEARVMIDSMWGEKVKRVTKVTPVRGVSFLEVAEILIFCVTDRKCDLSKTLPFCYDKNKF